MNAVTPVLPTDRVGLRVFARMLALCEAVSSKKEKEAHVAAALSDPAGGVDVLKLLTYALSPYVRFFTQQIPDAMQTPHVASMSTVYTTLDGLAARRVTGSEAKTAISMLLGLVDDDAGDCGLSERDALRRVLLKDLRAGFDTSTVNKAWKSLGRKGKAIEVFEVQLAEDASRTPLDTLVYPIYAEPKYDGVRTIAVKKDGIVTLFSRNGIPFENFEEIRVYLEQRMPDNLVLDGEVLHRTLLGVDGFKLVMKRCKASPGKNVDIPVRYQPFDILPLDEFEAQAPGLPYHERRVALVSAVDAIRDITGLISPAAQSYYCETPAQLDGVYRAAVDAGFEGIIAKARSAPYKYKRSTDWLKVKPFLEAELTVVGVIEGGGKYAGSLGALVCKGVVKSPDGNEVEVETDVGSGFTDELRSSIWGMANTGQDGDIVGKLIDVRYQDVTFSEEEEKWSLRFPTLLRVRSNDNGGKI